VFRWKEDALTAVLLRDLGEKALPSLEAGLLGKNPASIVGTIKRALGKETVGFLGIRTCECTVCAVSSGGSRFLRGEYSAVRCDELGTNSVP